MRQIPISSLLLTYLDELEFTEAALHADPLAAELAGAFEEEIASWPYLPASARRSTIHHPRRRARRRARRQPRPHHHPLRRTGPRRGQPGPQERGLPSLLPDGAVGVRALGAPQAVRAHPRCDRVGAGEAPRGLRAAGLRRARRLRPRSRPSPRSPRERRPRARPPR